MKNKSLTSQIADVIENTEIKYPYTKCERRVAILVTARKIIKLIKQYDK